MSNRAERRRLMFNRATGNYAEISPGPRVQADSKYNAKLPDPIPGEHLWIVMTSYKVRQPAALLGDEQWHLDMENLLSVDGPICYWCEEPWRDGVGACTGPV